MNVVVVLISKTIQLFLETHLLFFLLLNVEVELLCLNLSLHELVHLVVNNGISLLLLS